MSEKEDKLSVDKKVSMSASYEYSGPIPHPSILKQLEEIVSGSAEKIIKNAEEESNVAKSLFRQRTG